MSETKSPIYVHGAWWRAAQIIFVISAIASFVFTIVISVYLSLQVNPLVPEHSNVICDSGGGIKVSELAEALHLYDLRVVESVRSSTESEYEFLEDRSDVAAKVFCLTLHVPTTHTSEGQKMSPVRRAEITFLLRNSTGDVSQKERALGISKIFINESDKSTILTFSNKKRQLSHSIQ